MKLNDAARELIGNGADATLVTVNPDGSPQVSLVWVGLRSTSDGDELVTGHLSEHKKVRNIRRDANKQADHEQAAPADGWFEVGSRERAQKRAGR